MTAVALGLLSGLAWGFADFLGGLQSRRLPLLAVVLGSQLAGLVLIATVIAVRLDVAPTGDFTIYAALSGVAGAIGLLAFYRGLAVGAMGIVAPISATAAAIPVVVGIATGERPSEVQALGIALALAGVVLASREAGTETGRSVVAKGAGLAVLAAVGFGCFFLAMDRASDEDVLWAIFGNRVTSVTILSAAALVTRPDFDFSRADAGKIAAIGILDITANTLFAVAATKGLVSVVAVLGSLYPVVTVLLAHRLLHERIATLQRAGAIGALAGVVLMSAG